jgi:hypothetical protein
MKAFSRFQTHSLTDELTGQIIVPNAKRTKRPEIWLGLVTRHARDDGASSSSSSSAASSRSARVPAIDTTRCCLQGG